LVRGSLTPSVAFIVSFGYLWVGISWQVKVLGGERAEVWNSGVTHETVLR